MSSSTSKYNVLISGAGPSGLVLAWWLSHYGITSTIVERTPHLRAAGQSLDIRVLSLEVIKKMGLLEQVETRKTHEAGLIFVDEKDRAFATVPMTAAVSLTQDIEVLRGDLVDMWYESIKNNPDVKFIFGDYITSVEQDSQQLTVGLKSGRILTEFDLLVISDGMSSKTRGMVFDEPAPVKGLGHAFAFFTIPWEKQDGNWAKFYSTAGRQALLRPHAPSGTAAHLGMTTEDAGEYAKLDVKGQKALVRRLFANVGWEVPRMLAGMDEATDFYLSETAQVKIDKWHKGRVVLLGDSAWCSSPISGVGVTLSVMGAYMLAGELAANKTIKEAFVGYETQMRPHVNEAQALPPGVPGLVCPKSLFGIRVFRALMRVILAKRVLSFLSKSAALFGGDKPALELPVYPQIAPVIKAV